MAEVPHGKTFIDFVADPARESRAVSDDSTRHSIIPMREAADVPRRVSGVQLEPTNASTATGGQTIN